MSLPTPSIVLHAATASTQAIRANIFFTTLSPYSTSRTSAKRPAIAAAAAIAGGTFVAWRCGWLGGGQEAPPVVPAGPAAPTPGPEKPKEGPAPAQVKVEADADLGAGTVPIITLGDVEVVAGQAVSGTVSLSITMRPASVLNARR